MSNLFFMIVLQARSASLIAARFSRVNVSICRAKKRRPGFVHGFPRLPQRLIRISESGIRYSILPLRRIYESATVERLMRFL